MSDISFVKMHGLGNDFVVFDGRRNPDMLDLSPELASRIADRKTGIGCDQLIVIEPAPDKKADAFMRIRNFDGGEVEACGNATRCVAHLLMKEQKKNDVLIQTVVGFLEANGCADGQVSVDMGSANLGWADIPLSQACDTASIDVSIEGLPAGVGVNVGNPHIVFFVDDAEDIDVEKLGPVIEHHRLFPARTNVEFCSLLGPDKIRMRVWERGVGITRACGTGACATAVAAARLGLTSRKSEVVLDGGPLLIEWKENNHILMTGPVATSFHGVLASSFLA